MDQSKKYFWILLDVLLAALAVNVVFFVMPAISRFGASFTPARTLTVSAQGKTTVTPDLAEASFSVVTQGKNPTDLANSNNQKMSAVIQFLKSQGLEDKDIKTTAYDLLPNYKYDKGTGRDYITGYTITQAVDVKMRDFTKVPDIIGGLTPLGVNQIGGINFTVENEEKFLAVARSQAFEVAKAKAVEMAQENGAKLGRAVSVNESSGVPPVPPIYYNRSLGMSFGVGAPEISAPTIQPGTQDITDNVTVTYELR